MRRILLAVLLFAVIPAHPGARAQEPAVPVSDAAALRQLLREAATEAARRSVKPAVSIAVRPEQAHGTVLQVFAEVFQERQKTVLLPPESGDERLTVDIRDMHSSTARGGNSSYFRTTRTTLGMLLEDTRERRVLWSQELALTRTDTLDGDAPYAQKSWLDEGPSWWEGVLEPALISVTAIVIVLLLFTVRGSS